LTKVSIPKKRSKKKHYPPGIMKKRTLNADQPLNSGKDLPITAKGTLWSIIHLPVGDGICTFEGAIYTLTSIFLFSCLFSHTFLFLPCPFPGSPTDPNHWPGY
jgi:hypothetical protein